MKLSQELNDALNQQILHELNNSVQYMQMASFFEGLQLKKLAEYFKKQSNHEKDHADKFMDYINSRTGGKVAIPELSFEVHDLKNVESLALFYVGTEENTTVSIEALYDLALEEKSYIDLGFLQTMLNEQVEEEDSATEFLDRIKNVKDIVLFDALFGE